jgi:hypothetical protein
MHLYSVHCIHKQKDVVLIGFICTIQNGTNYLNKIFVFKTSSIAKKVVFCRILMHSLIFRMQRGKKVPKTNNVL